VAAAHGCSTEQDGVGDGYLKLKLGEWIKTRPSCSASGAGLAPCRAPANLYPAGQGASRKTVLKRVLCQQRAPSFPGPRRPASALSSLNQVGVARRTSLSLGSRVLENGKPTDNDDGGRLRKGISLALPAGLARERGGATLTGGPALSAVLAPAASALVLANAGPITVHAVAASAPVLANAAPSTVHALAAYPLVMTDPAPSAVYALAALAPMLADAGPATVHAPAALAPMLADAGPSTIHALASYPPMLADAGPSTVFAVVAASAVLALRRWHRFSTSYTRW